MTRRASAAGTPAETPAETPAVDSVGQGSDESFPASDPPAWMGSASTVTTATTGEERGPTRAQSGASQRALAVVVGPDDHAQGPAGAPVTLVVYGNFECPFSRRARTVIRAVQQQRSDTFRYVFRNFPLEDSHPHAFRAAEAAEAAGAHGKYWETHHELFDNPAALEDADLFGYAAALGLDGERFRGDMAGHTHAARIRADVDGGVRSGVPGTPTFFVDGVYYTDLEGDPQLLRDALDRAAAAGGAGAARDQ